MGKEVPKEMKFWTKEQYLKFAEAMMDKPRSYYAFEMLYWTGIREGELLALTPLDFDFEKQTVRINKTYHRMKKQDIITSPKTAKSNRIVVMPEFLCEEMQDYFQMYYSLAPDQRIFPFSKSYLKHEMERGCKATGVPTIRIHDLRHPYVKHTAKNISLQKQKSQTTNSNLIVWVFCFRVLFLMPLALVGKC